MSVGVITGGGGGLGGGGGCVRLSCVCVPESGTCLSALYYFSLSRVSSTGRDITCCVGPGHFLLGESESESESPPPVCWLFLRVY